MTTGVSTESTTGVSVELTDLTRVYGTVRALDGLTLHMKPGEFIALLGPSGCGKTTALRILAGLDEATSGTVAVGGRDVTRVPANKRDMGMVFQAYSLFPHLTALQNVEFGLKVRGKAKRDRATRAGDMLDLVGLSAHVDKYAVEMSGGQQQRVALARALGDRAERAAARRAAVGARRQGAHPAAGRDPPRAARRRHDDAVRHPRPGGGVGRRRPGRRDEPGPARAARSAREGVRRSRDTVRGRVRRPEQQGARPRRVGPRGTARHVGPDPGRVRSTPVRARRCCGPSR